MTLRTILATTFLAGLTAGCMTAASDTAISSSQAMKTTITGEVFYLSRIALPPGAELSVILLDTSLSNPLANLFADTKVLLDNKNVPVPFSMVADHSMLISGDTYEVRAVIRSAAGDIIWRTKKGHVVDLSSSNYDAGKLELTMVDFSADSGISALFGDAWIVEDLNGGGIIDSSNVTISFNAEGQISGSGGCNYYSGNYAVSEKAINMVGGMVLTQKACAPALMEQDQKLLTLLQSAKNYSVNDGLLTIVGKNGRTLTARRN